MLLNNLKVLCTGNPNKDGITKEIVKIFPNAVCLHLSMGIDLTTQKGLDYFRSIISDYDVFVNVSNIKNRTQEKLLRIAFEEGMKGNIFNIGSISEYDRWSWYDKNYTEEKRQLRETSLELCTEDFKTTHIIVGGFRDYEDNSLDRMDPKEIIKVIEQIINSNVNIPIIGIEKINKQMEEKLNGKLQNTR